MPENWEPAGIIGVDSGLCWIGDPAYCVTPDAECHPAPTWPEFCESFRKAELGGSVQWRFGSGQPGLGVSMETGHGDGLYNVYIRRDANSSRIQAAKVVFMDEPGEPYLNIPAAIKALKGLIDIEDDYDDRVREVAAHAHRAIGSTQARKKGRK